MEFIPSLPVLSTFAIAGIVLAITPGPDMTLFLSRALVQSRAAGMMAMLGATTGVMVHTFLAAFGISALIQASPMGFWLLKLAGALYLLWLAIQAIRQGTSFVLEVSDKKEKSLFANWLTGIGINLLNPKVVLFFITFLPQFVSSSDPHAAGKMIFLGFFFIVIATITCAPMIIAVDSIAERLKRSPKIVRMVDWLFAGVFSVFAVRILLINRA